MDLVCNGYATLHYWNFQVDNASPEAMMVFQYYFSIQTEGQMLSFSVKTTICACQDISLLQFHGIVKLIQLPLKPAGI